MNYSTGPAFHHSILGFPFRLFDRVSNAGAGDNERKVQII
jgi:hypothetical protein